MCVHVCMYMLMYMCIDMCAGTSSSSSDDDEDLAQVCSSFHFEFSVTPTIVWLLVDDAMWAGRTSTTSQQLSYTNSFGSAQAKPKLCLIRRRING